MSRPTLKRLAGRADAKGVEFEYKIAALLALRARRQGLRFQLYSNVEAARPWDDLVLRVEGQRSITYFIQLKHGKKGSSVTSQDFCSDGKNDFSLRKYFKEFRVKHKQPEDLTADERTLRNWMLEDFRFVIYTNKKTNKHTPSPEAQELDFENLLETGDRKNTFSFHDGDEEWKLLEDDEYRKEFLPRLRVFGSQAHVNALDDLIVQELNSMFGKRLLGAKEYAMSYMERFKEWAESKRGLAVTQFSGELEEVLAEDLRRRTKSAAGDGVLAFQENHCTALRETLAQFDSVLVEVLGVPCGHRVAKVQQVLDQDFPRRWAYADDRIVRELPPDALLAACGACDVVVVDVDRVPKQVQDFVTAVDKNPKLKLVVLNADYGKDGYILRGIVKFQKIFKEDWRLEYLVPEAQESMMEKTLDFQGALMPLGELRPTWPGLRRDVDGPLLSALARGVAALGEAPAEDDDTPHHLPRTLTHTSVLHREVLRLADDPSEHLVLWGFSREELEESRGMGEYQNAWTVPGFQTNRWTVLSTGEEYTDDNIMPHFEMLCLINHRRDAHLIQNMKGTILWRATRGSSDKIAKYVVPRDESCKKPYNPDCVHENSAVESAVAWSDRVHLLLGQPGIGKSSFMCSLAARQHEQAPETWAVVVRLLEHLELLEKMPDPEDMNESNVACVLAAAAGVAAPASSAARRCLEAALFRSGAVHIFVDGVDEVMPAYKEKALRLLDLILKETRAARVWVASRPEVDTSLRGILPSSRISLLPLSSAEQVTYLRKRWTFAGLGYPEDAMERLAKEVVDAFALNSGKEEGNAVHEISDHSDRLSLLGVPLNLRMAADAFADDARTALKTKRTLRQIRVSQLDLFRRFVDRNIGRCRERYGIKDPVVEITNLSSDKEDVFVPLHQSCAMSIWTAASIPYCQNRFQESVKEYQKYLSGEKSGILWQREDGMLQFSHYMFVEYFVATWLFKNLKESRKHEQILEEAVRGEGKVMFFLDLMLAEGRPLHKAIIEDNKDILDSPILRGNEIDLGGRSALHLASAYGRTDAVDKFLEAGYDVSQCDSLLHWTPLQYADATLELEAMEKLLNSNADSGQLRNTRLATKNNPFIIVRAVQLDLVEVTRVILTGLPASTISYSDNHNISGIPAEQVFKWTVLHIAAGAGSTGVAQLLIDKRINVNCWDIMRRTPLHHAVAGGHIDMVKLLLSSGVDAEINSGDIWQNTPLYLAAAKGHKEMVQLLIEHGANISRKTVHANTPMHIVALNGDEETTEVLLSLGADIHCRGQHNATPLHYATHEGHVNVVQLLLSCGADVSIRDNDGRTAMHYAASCGHMHVMKVFFENLTPNSLQREINYTDEQQFSPLHLAVAKGHKDIVQLLMENGANISLRTEEGLMSMHIAALNGDEETTEVLLSLGADVNCCGYHNATPLYYASHNGHVNVVKLLLSHKADVSWKDINGRTAIHSAAFGGHKEVVEELLRADGEVDSCDSLQRTPLSIAAGEGHDKVVQLLLSNGADVNRTTGIGISTLHVASLFGHLPVVQVLLHAGADVNICDTAGMSALHLAALNGHADIARLLLSHGADAHKMNNVGLVPMQFAFLNRHNNVAIILLRESFRRALSSV